MENLVNKVISKLHDSPRGDMAVLLLLSNALSFLFKESCETKTTMGRSICEAGNVQGKVSSSKHSIFPYNFLWILSRIVVCVCVFLTFVGTPLYLLPWYLGLNDLSFIYDRVCREHCLISSLILQGTFVHLSGKSELVFPFLLSLWMKWRS